MLKSILLGFIVFASISIIKCQNSTVIAINAPVSTSTPTPTTSNVHLSESNFDEESNLMKYAKAWFIKMKDTRKLIKNKTEEGFQEAMKNFTQFNEKLLTYKKSNFEIAKSWILSNCPKCEQDKFNDSTVDECFKGDQKIQEINLEFNNYMGCILRLMLDLKNPNQNLDSSFKKFEEQEKLIALKYIGQEIYHDILNTLSDLMNTVQNLTQNQWNMLKEFSYHEYEITRSESYYEPYSRYTRNRNVAEKVSYFNSKCYNLFTYDQNLVDSTFEMFRKCIVKKTCNDKIYQQYKSDQ